VLSNGQPLQVLQFVAPAADQRLLMVCLVARARPARLAGAWAWLLALELGANRAAAVSSAGVEHKQERQRGRDYKS
jgi:hypothetical protein